MPSYVFGPVPSRRLGRSLGVDLVPFKTCTYDCIYCQLGPTTCKTIQRKEWVPLQDTLDQVRENLVSKPDYITLSGSGEPTLYSRIGELIEGIQSVTRTPVAVLTNGSLLGVPEVREALKGAALVAPSLDAGDKRIFRFVNRPHEAIEFEAMVEGLMEFRRTYTGKFWLEVLLVAGVTGIASEVQKIAAIVRKMGPDRVQLNTVTRPPCEHIAHPVSSGSLERLARLFGTSGEVIAECTLPRSSPDFKARRQDVLDLLSRRPCTLEDIAAGLDMHRSEVAKYIKELEYSGQVEQYTHERAVYYKRGSCAAFESQ